MSQNCKNPLTCCEGCQKIIDTDGTGHTDREYRKRQVLCDVRLAIDKALAMTKFHRCTEQYPCKK